MTAYYNEFDPYAAQWLRNLIDAGLIPAGDVDTRSIEDVTPNELRGYTQCHFFAGIGGWAFAARLAGWPDDRELWTGSPPCQPFSVAGMQRGQDDERHLWPHLFRLASARRPAVIMGEQVAAAVGKNWLDGVFADLESIGYACGAAVVPACAVDAPHRRDRLWFVARDGAVGDADRDGWQTRHRNSEAARHGSPTAATGGDGAVADALREGSHARAHGGVHSGQEGHRSRDVESVRHSSTWDGAAWIIGHDGKARRVEPGIRLLAHGVSGRMAVVRPGFEGRAEVQEALHWYSRSGALKGFGNAIVPQVAAEVIRAFMDCMPAPPTAAQLKQQQDQESTRLLTHVGEKQGADRD